MSTEKGQTQYAKSRTSSLTEMNWNNIERPGCYLAIDSGILLRVPAEGLAAGHSPLITVSTPHEFRVAKLSDNPAEPVSVLRAIAANNDYLVGF